MTRTDDRGAVPTLELVLVTPVLVVLLLLVVFAGRLGRTEQLVRDAAAAGARAASLRQDEGPARADAEAVVTETLRETGVACRQPQVAFPVLDLQPGGQVSIVVTCHIDNGDLTLLTVPGAHVVTGRATEVVDTYRAG